MLGGMKRLALVLWLLPAAAYAQCTSPGCPTPNYDKITIGSPPGSGLPRGSVNAASYFQNGQAFTGATVPGGAQTNVQFFGVGAAFGGDSTFTFNSTTKAVGGSIFNTPNDAGTNFPGSAVAGFQQNGYVLIRATGNANGTVPICNNAPSCAEGPITDTFGGIGAGANIPLYDYLTTAFGWHALNAANPTAGEGTESTAFGYNACGFMSGSGPYYNTCVGINAMGTATNGNAVYSNVAVGTDAMRDVQSVNNSVAVGQAAMFNYVGTASVALGTNALKGNSALTNTSFNDVAIGNQALFGSALVADHDNTAVGARTMFQGVTTASSVVAVGSEAGYNITSAVGPVYIGSQAGFAQTFNGGNVGIGYRALFNDVNGGSDTCVGYAACVSEPGRNHLTAIGFDALYSETSIEMTAIGSSAMQNSIGSGETTAVGINAGRDGISPFGLYVGYVAGNGNSNAVTLGGSATTGDLLTVTLTSTIVPGLSGGVSATYTVLNTDTLSTIAAALASAVSALNISYSGISVTASTSFITGGPPAFYLDYQGTSTVGAEIVVTATAGGAATETFAITGGFTGGYNTALGFGSLICSFCTTAQNNVAIGPQTMPWATTASQNIAIGKNVAEGATTAVNNTLVGVFAAAALTAGNFNTVVGSSAATALTTSLYNVIIGYNAGTTLTTGLGANVIIGPNVASTTLTTGVGNILIGVSATTDTAAGSTSNTYKLQGNGTTPIMTATGINSTPALTLYGTVTLNTLSTGSAATYACFTSGGQLISSSAAC
jgi:trimeric autotransporter adhesin